MTGKKALKSKAVGTRREKVESKEAAIIKVAYQMIAEQGFAKTTMAEIAKAAGVADGTLYLYFNNKEALARAVLDAFYSELTNAARKGVAKRDTTSARLKFLARNHLTSILAKKRILELLTILDRNPETYDGSEIYKMNREYVAVFDDVIREAVWRGDILKSKNPWILRDIFFGALEYAMRTMLIKKRQRKIGDVVDELAGLIISPAAEQKQPPARNHAYEKAVERLENSVVRLESALTAISHPGSQKT